MGAAVLSAGGRGMKRDVVKDGMNATPVQLFDHSGSFLNVSHKDVVHVCVVLDVLGHDRPSQQPVVFEGREPFVICGPYAAPVLEHGLGAFELPPKEGGAQ